MITAMLDLTPPNLLSQTSVPFRDARGCKDWLATLPITDVSRAHAAMTEGIDSLNLTEMPGYERLKIMELMRDKVAFLQDSVADVYLGKPLPLSGRALDMWESTETLWQGMEQGYRYCLRSAANDDAETARHFALIVERCLRYTGLQMLHYRFVYREVPERLIKDLHALYHFAEKRGVAHVTVKDSLDGHRGVITPTQAYVRALLVDAARSGTLAPNEMIAVDGLLKRWASKVIISRIPPEDSPAVLRCTDLAGTRGLWTPSSKPSEDGTVIFFDLKELSDSLRRRIRKLAAGVPWNELSLPSVFANVAVTSLLTHTYSAWCEGAPREALIQPGKEECEVATGSLEVLYHCLAGRPFEAPRQTNGMGALEAQQMAVFGKVIGRITADEPSVPSPAEPWKLEGAGMNRVVLRRPTNSKMAFGRQHLIAYRRGGNPVYELGVVVGVTDQGNNGFVIEVVPLTNQAEAVVFRAKDMAFSPAIKMTLLDESGKINLLLPLGVYQHNKVIEVRANVVNMYRLTGVAQHGANFDRVSCELL